MKYSKNDKALHINSHELTSIGVVEGKLKVFNCWGYDCIVNIDTGKIIETEFIK